ncbi:hypothetical protein AMECASPLE_015464 [Ameca splendens]|uniref:Uncharacterized protein n=1 Tax=Ameca splendens TaxID=208324 RepID=A0ABV0Y1S0_9TELE
MVCHHCCHDVRLLGDNLIGDHCVTSALGVLDADVKPDSARLARILVLNPTYNSMEKLSSSKFNHHAYQVGCIKPVQLELQKFEAAFK